MKREHLTPDGWKPCIASMKDCKYTESRIADSSAFIDSAVEDVQAGKPHAIKNFFNTLFGTKTIPSQKLPEMTAIPQRALDEPILDKVIQGEDGQYEVICLNIQDHDRPRTHRFGDLITDKAIAERLHQADPHKHYQLGLCDRLAEELWTFSKQVEEYYVFNDELQLGRHHFVKLKDGTYADSLGIWTEEAFFSNWENNRPTLDGTKVRKNPFLAISNPELFSTVNEFINKQMAGKTL